MRTKVRSAGAAPKRRALPPALEANRWKPGQSGNPSGQSGAYGEAISLARQAAPEAMRRLIELMRSEDERVAAVACNAILDRALGKAVAQQPENDSLANRIAKMTADERARDALELMARARRRLGQYRRTIEHEGSGEPAQEPAHGPESQE